MILLPETPQSIAPNPQDVGASFKTSIWAVYRDDSDGIRFEVKLEEDPDYDFYNNPNPFGLDTEWWKCIATRVNSNYPPYKQESFGTSVYGGNDATLTELPEGTYTILLMGRPAGFIYDPYDPDRYEYNIEIARYQNINIQTSDTLSVRQVSPNPVQIQSNQTKALIEFEIKAQSGYSVKPAFEYLITDPAVTEEVAKSQPGFVAVLPKSPGISLEIGWGAYRLWVRSLLSPDGPRPQEGQLFSSLPFTVLDVPEENAQILAFAAPISSTPVLAPDKKTGSITIYTTGGAGNPIRAIIDTDAPRTKYFQITSPQNSVTFEGIPPGTYTVTINDTQSYGVNQGPKVIETTIEIPTPDLAIGDQLTFLPWLQPKLTHAASSGPGYRPQLDLRVKLATNGTAVLLPSVKAEIYGPGDVLGVNTRAILGTTPDPNAVGASPLQLASIEFKEEDFPWRYSEPARKVQPPALPVTPAPWCFLLVLEEDEYTSLPLTGQPLPAIKVKANVPYPAADQQALWAHVQINARLSETPLKQPSEPEINAFLQDVLPGSPELAYSRIFCPRRLAPNTSYQAFLLPALEAGRQAGLGGPITTNSATIPSFPTTAEDRDFPVYFQWKFTTGAEDDFESLAQQLHQASNATAVASAPSLAVTAGTTTHALSMPTVFVDPSVPVAETVPLPIAQDLYLRLTPTVSSNSRPIVQPPLYGRAYMNSPSLTSPTTHVATSWQHTVNLDPRYRALAALGVQVVQDNQEEYVRRAWDQVQDILLTNEKLRGAQYGLRTTAGLRDQHLPVNTTTIVAATNGPSASYGAQEEDQQPAALVTNASQAASTNGLADYGLHLTGLALSRIRTSPATAATAATIPDAPSIANLTLREVIRRSSTPLAAFSPAFRRIVKPFGNYSVGIAGRPLRPTQPEVSVLDTAEVLHSTGTSLRQRDVVLSNLAQAKLTAAPARTERVRALQFADDVVDRLLLGNTPLTLRWDGTAITDPTVLDRFNQAYSSLKAMGPDVLDDRLILGFKRPQRIRPSLPLAAIKQDVIQGTHPGPLFLVRVQKSVPTLPLPRGDYQATDFNATDFYVGDFDEPVLTSPTAILQMGSVANSLLQETFSADAGQTSVQQSSSGVTAPAITTAVRTMTDADIPAIPQAKVIPVFKDAMGESLRQLRPELFVPGLAEFPSGGVAVLEVNQAVIEAYMLGLNHALGSELLWRGFPVDLRGTFFQQFWDVSEYLHTQTAPGTTPTATAEAELLDVLPLDEWGNTLLGQNGPPASEPASAVRLVLRSELLRRYPTLVVGLQLGTASGPAQDSATMVYPRQRLPVGKDMVLLSFDLALATATSLPENGGYYLVLMERPGQPQFGLDELAPRVKRGYTMILNEDNIPVQTDYVTSAADDPLTWDDFSWEYLGTEVGENITIIPTGPTNLEGKPKAPAEHDSLKYLTDSATVAYALFQQPVLAAISLHDLLS